MTVFFCSRSVINDCRQAVSERILQLSAKAALWISSETKELFSECSANHLNISENPMTEASKDDFCYTNSISSIIKHSEDIEMIVLYRNTGSIPDGFLFIEMLSDWQLIGTNNFESEHGGLIAEELYVKK